VQEEVAETLARLSGLERAFFANSGAEANEGALKIARRYGHDRGVERPEVVVMQGAFHGRTLATLTATGNRKVQAGFEPLMPGFKRVPFDDLEALERITSDNTVAVLVEPIQGENGVVLPGEDYLAGLRRLCDERGWLLMVDEIQTGLGRTGAWFAYQHAGITPDVVTLAKALGNGVPVGAVLAGGEAARALGPGSHGTTFGGGPLAMAAARAVLTTLEADSLVAHAGSMGDYLQQRLWQELGDLEAVQTVRGQGLMVGVVLDREPQGLPGRALEHGLLVNVAGGNVIRLLPPLVISREEVDRVVTILRYLLEEGP
jgi:acetylornithine aminotransferase